MLQGNAWYKPARYAGMAVLASLFAYGMGSAFQPLAASVALAYLLFPAIQWLERHRVRRTVAALALFSSVSFLLLILVLYVLPAVWRDSRQLIQQAPVFLGHIIERLERFAGHQGLDWQLDQVWLMDTLRLNVQNFSQVLFHGAGKALGSTFNGLAAGLVMVLNLFLFPVFFFYIINRYEAMRSLLENSLPDLHRTRIMAFLHQVDGIFSAYVRGQLMVASTLALLYATGLSLAGLKFGLVIGLLTGLLSVIPFVGVTLGLTASILLLLADGSSGAAWFAVLAVFAVIQAVESFWLTPNIVGKNTRLGELSVMLALIIGGNLFGMLGMLLAIPVAATLRMLVLDYRQQRGLFAPHDFLQP